jgi:hypothetical protein
MTRFCSQTIISGVTSEMIDRIPGKSNDRRTALGMRGEERRGEEEEEG